MHSHTASPRRQAVPAGKVDPFLQHKGFVRLETVLQRIPVSRTTWLAGCRTGIYPAPIRIGARAVAWRIEDIERLLAEGVTG